MSGAPVVGRNAMNRGVVAVSSREFTRCSEGDCIELNDGRILFIFMQFSGDGSDFARTRLVATESRDGGLTWQGLRVVAETNPGDVNVYSPNLIRARDGGILLLFHRHHSLEPSQATQYLWKSMDEGCSFTPVATFADRQPCSLCNAVFKRLSDGRLIVPLCVNDKLEKTPYGHRHYGGVWFSDDDGRTWRESPARLSLPMRGVMEPHVEETRDGRVLMVMRNQLGSLFMAESGDGGVTWSKPQTTGLRSPESCPELVRIPVTGDLLMIWNNSPYDPAYRSHYGKRTPLTTAVSRDEGRTWLPGRDIEDDPRRAFSNPGCRFLRNGNAVVNYWTCEYLPNGAMQDVIDQRIAILGPDWFHG